MMRRLVRGLGVLLLLAGLALAARDLMVWLRGGGFAPEALGELWYGIDAASLDGLQALVERQFGAPLWNGIELWLLLQPACLVGVLLGLVVVVLTRPPRRVRGFR